MIWIDNSKSINMFWAATKWGSNAAKTNAHPGIFSQINMQLVAYEEFSSHAS